jgi:hypothetical protein
MPVIGDIRRRRMPALCFVSLTLSACASNKAAPSALTGDDQTHERHATGIDSQVHDN